MREASSAKCECEEKLVQPGVSEGKLVQSSVSEEKVVQPSVSERKSWYSQV